MANLTHIESAARRKLGCSEDWKGFQFESVSGDYIIIGDIPAGHFTRGKRKGRPRWEGPGTKVIVTGTEVQAEINRYVEATGNCPDCLGTKEEIYRWSRTEGVQRCPCSTCKGTGKRI